MSEIAMRNKLIEAAFDVFLDRPEIAPQAVALQAGVSRATFYRYFSSLDRLLAEMQQLTIQDLKCASKKMPVFSTSEDGLRWLHRAYIEMGKRYYFFAQKLMAIGLDESGDLENEQQLLYSLIEEAKNEGLSDREIPVKWIMRVFDITVLAASRSLSVREMSTDQSKDWGWRVLINGFQPEDPYGIMA